jgi:hypothetical protein
MENSQSQLMNAQVSNFEIHIQPAYQLQTHCTYLFGGVKGFLNAYPKTGLSLYPDFSSGTHIQTSIT